MGILIMFVLIRSIHPITRQIPSSSNKLVDSSDRINSFHHSNKLSRVSSLTKRNQTAQSQSCLYAERLYGLTPLAPPLIPSRKRSPGEGEEPNSHSSFSLTHLSVYWGRVECIRRHFHPYPCVPKFQKPITIKKPNFSGR